MKVNREVNRKINKNQAIGSSLILDEDQTSLFSKSFSLKKEQKTKTVSTKVL